VANAPSISPTAQQLPLRSGVRGDFRDAEKSKPGAVVSRPGTFTGPSRNGGDRRTLAGPTMTRGHRHFLSAGNSAESRARSRHARQSDTREQRGGCAALPDGEAAQRSWPPPCLVLNLMRTLQVETTDPAFDHYLKLAEIPALAERSVRAKVFTSRAARLVFATNCRRGH